MVRDGACYVESVDEATVVPVLRRWRAMHPAMGILAFLPEPETAALPRLQAACRGEGIPLSGGIFPAVLRDERFVAAGGWLLRVDGSPPALLFELPVDGADLGGTADALAARLKTQVERAGEKTLLLLFDGLFPRVGTLLDLLYLRLQDRVHYMGACAGSESFKPLPCLFDGDRAIQGGVLALVLPNSRGAVLEHGYGVPDRMITATSTEGNRILQIDWLPAFDVYRALGRELYGAEVTRENFYEMAVHFPFGIVRANGIIVVRIPVALEADGSLFCVGEVPPNSILTLLAAPRVDSDRTVEALSSGLAAQGVAPTGRELLLFACAGRRLHLGIPAAEAELAALKARTRAERIAGALSLGEIGSTAEWAYPLFHNATLIGSAWGRM